MHLLNTCYYALKYAFQNSYKYMHLQDLAQHYYSDAI
jgi:hypothetical protein